MTRVRWLSLVLGASAAGLVLLPLSGGVAARDSMAAVALPDRLADYSHLTADLSDAASGRAVALYQRGFGVEFLDAPQAVVLAADDDVYRRLDAAERRSGPQDQGDPGPMLLSPDGSAVALGDHDAHDPDLGVVDLSTGAVVDHPLPHARSVVPLAWSADGAQIAYLAGESPTNPHSGGPPVGDLFVLDLGSGEASPVPGVERAWMAAFSPDGLELAVRRSGQGNGGTSVVDLSEGTVRVLPVAGALSSPAAWSPDGSLLAVSAPSGLSFVEADGSAPEPVRLALDDPERAEFLGWTSDREVAVLERSGADTAHLVALPLDGGDARQLTTVDDLGSYGIGRLQLASALLPGIDVRVAGDPDRGPLPARFRIPLALLVGLAAAALVMLGTRATRRHRGVVAREPDSCESTCPA